MEMNTKNIVDGALREYSQMIKNCFKGISKPLENKIAEGLEVIEKINLLTSIPKQTRNQIKAILFHKLVKLQKAETDYDVTLSIMGTTRKETGDCLMSLVNDIFNGDEKKIKQKNNLETSILGGLKCQL